METVGEINAVLRTLTEREASMIQLRYGLGDGRPITYDEIGQVYRISRQKIARLVFKTFGKIIRDLGASKATR